MFIKYPKIKILGDRNNDGILTESGKIVIQEKVDGANFGFYVKDDILYFCSHNQNLTDSEQISKTGIPKNWKGIEPVLESFQHDPLMFNKDLYYYGESLQKHTISYDDIPGFIGYDVMSIHTGIFFDWKFAKQVFGNLNLPFIKTHEIEYNEKYPEKITIDYLKQFYAHSAYRDGSAEGIVIKRYDNQLMAKIVDDKFKEKAKQPKLEINSTNEQRIVETYATSPRIEKMIYKLNDNGYEIKMPLMRTLYIQVAKDILEEEILAIYSEYKSINFNTFNNLIGKKCSIVLKKVIMDDIK